MSLSTAYVLYSFLKSSVTDKLRFTNSPFAGLLTAEEMRRINLNKRLSEPYPFSKEDHQNVPDFSAREARLWNMFFSYTESDFIGRYTKEEHQNAPGWDAQEARMWNSDFLYEYLDNPVTKPHFKKYESKKDKIYTLEEYKKAPGIEEDRSKPFSYFEYEEDIERLNSMAKTRLGIKQK